MRASTWLCSMLWTKATAMVTAPPLPKLPPRLPTPAVLLMLPLSTASTRTGAVRSQLAPARFPPHTLAPLRIVASTTSSISFTVSATVTVMVTANEPAAAEMVTLDRGDRRRDRRHTDRGPGVGRDGDPTDARDRRGIDAGLDAVGQRVLRRCAGTVQADADTAGRHTEREAHGDDGGVERDDRAGVDGDRAERRDDGRGAVDRGQDVVTDVVLGDGCGARQRHCGARAIRRNR